MECDEDPESSSIGSIDQSDDESNSGDNSDHELPMTANPREIISLFTKRDQCGYCGAHLNSCYRFSLMTIYTLHGPVYAKHWEYLCSRRKCRARFRYGYSKPTADELHYEPLGDNQFLLTSEVTGFEVIYSTIQLYVLQLSSTECLRSN